MRDRYKCFVFNEEFFQHSDTITISTSGATFNKRFYKVYHNLVDSGSIHVLTCFLVLTLNTHLFEEHTDQLVCYIMHNVGKIPNQRKRFKQSQNDKNVRCFVWYLVSHLLWSHLHDRKDYISVIYSGNSFCVFCVFKCVQCICYFVFLLTPTLLFKNWVIKKFYSLSKSSSILLLQFQFLFRATILLFTYLFVCNYILIHLNLRKQCNFAIIQGKNTINISIFSSSIFSKEIVWARHSGVVIIVVLVLILS